MPDGRLMEEAGIQAVIKGLGSFKAGAGEMEGAIKGIGDSAGAAQKPVGGLRAHLDEMAQSAGAATIAFGGLAAAGVALIGSTVMVAARNEELLIILNRIGKNAGYSREELAKYEKQVKDAGITTGKARDILILMIQSELDLADATKLARTAQDLATIGQMDSSAAAKILTETISSQNTMRLRQFGLTKTAIQVFEEFAGAEQKVTTSTVDNSEAMNTLATDMNILTAEIQLHNEELALQIGYWGENDNRVRRHRLQVEKMTVRLGKMTTKYNKLAGEQGKVITTTQGISKELTAQEKKQALVNYILTEGEKVAGLYEDAMTSVSKQIRSLPRHLHELANAFGSFFLEPLSGGVMLLTDFLVGLRELPPEIMEMAASFVIMGTAASAAVAGLAGMFKMAPLLAGALSFLITPLGLLAAGLGVLAGAFVLDIGGIRAKAMPVLQNLATVFQERILPVLLRVAGAIKSVIDGIIDLFTGKTDRALLNFATAVRKAFGIEAGLEFLDRLKEIRLTIEEIVNSIGETIQDFFVLQGTSVRHEMGQLRERILEAWAAIQKIVLKVVGGIIESVLTAWATIRKWTDKNWSTIRAFIKAVLDWIRSFVELTLKNITRIFGSAWQIIREWTEENWPLIQQTIETILTYIMNIISYILRVITVFWEKWGQDLLAFAQFYWDIIRTVIETIIKVILGIIKVVMLLIQGEWSLAWEEVKNILSTIWDAMLKIINLALDKIKELIPRFHEAGKDLMRGFLRGMKRMKKAIVDWIMGLLRSIVGRIKDFFGFDSPSRLMAGYGRDVMAGFIKGMEGMRPALESQLRMTLAPVMQVAAPQSATSPVMVQGGSTFNYNLSANYSQMQSPASIMDDLQALEMLVGARG